MGRWRLDDDFPRGDDRAGEADLLGDARPPLRERLRPLLGRLRDAWGVDEFGGPRRAAPVEGRLHHATLLCGVIGVAALVISMTVLPGAAVLGKVTGGLADKFAVPVKKVKLPRIAQRSVVYDRDGEVIATLAGEENRAYAPLEEVAKIAQEAVLAIEDAGFYQHRGVALGGLVRALLTNVRSGEVRQGGSTITQQLVKNVLVGGERSVERKIREAQLAVALEKRMSKRQILELYLNEAYFGEGVYGIATAAEYYFGKSATELTLPEAALLAGVIRAPETYDPLDNPKAAKARRKLVLQRMADEGFIKRNAVKRAARAPLGATRHPLPEPEEPYFVELVKAQIMEDERFGKTTAERARAIFQGGLRIETTLDLDVQQHAQSAVEAVLTEADDPATALAAIDPATGALRAMVGGRDFDKNKYNLAVQGKRAAGSTFKPFTMVTALDTGVPPGLELETPSPLRLADHEGRPWPVNNYSQRDEGVMDMRRATELSVNTYYAQLILRVGPERVVDTAERMGITSELKPYPSLALGVFDVSPYELASAYATLAAGGIYCKPYVVTRVTDAAGKEILRREPSCRRVIDGAIAAQASAILQGVIDRGTGRANASIGRPAAGKTGTTDEYTDAWFVGYTPQLATAVWMGYPESTRRKLYGIHGLSRVYGGSLPAMIWGRFMRAAHEGLPVERFPEPPPTRTAVVPDVREMTEEEATEALEEAGFTVAVERVRSALDRGLVAGQSPAAGERIEAGTLVTLEVSRGKPAKEKAKASPSPSPGGD